MNLTPKDKKFQPADKTETNAKWEDCIVEELSDEAQAIVCGGARWYPNTTLSEEQELQNLSFAAC